MIDVKNIAEFNKALNKVMTVTEDGAVDVLKKVSFDTLRNLQKKTPRKTGRARAGWNIKIDQKPSEWKPPKGQKSYSDSDFEGESRIKFDSVINLSNNVEYIIPLDEGHSKQATAIVNPVISRMKAFLQYLLSKESKRKIK